MDTKFQIQPQNSKMSHGFFQIINSLLFDCKSQDKLSQGTSNFLHQWSAINHPVCFCHFELSRIKFNSQLLQIDKNGTFLKSHISSMKGMEGVTEHPSPKGLRLSLALQGEERNRDNQEAVGHEVDAEVAVAAIGVPGVAT